VKCKTASMISWIFKSKQKGMSPIGKDDESCEESSCDYGSYQAMPSAFQHEGFVGVPIIPPELAGAPMAKKIAMFSVTNTVAMDQTVASFWKKAMQQIYAFAINECGLAMRSTGDVMESNGALDGQPALFLLSGALNALGSATKTIGNGVTVPEMVWMAGCCSSEHRHRSFGIYTYNRFGQRPSIVSLDKLQLLLQSMYFDNVNKVNIDLFPGFNGICLSPENDVASEIFLK